MGSTSSEQHTYIFFSMRFFGQLLSIISYCSWSKIMTVTRIVMVTCNKQNGSFHLCGQAVANSIFLRGCHLCLSFWALEGILVTSKGCLACCPHHTPAGGPEGSHLCVLLPLSFFRFCSLLWHPSQSKWCLGVHNHKSNTSIIWERW